MTALQWRSRPKCRLAVILPAVSRLVEVGDGWVLVGPNDPERQAASLPLVPFDARVIRTRPVADR